LTTSQRISIVLALIYISVGTFVGNAHGMFCVVLLLILPMACIWYPEEMGGYTGTCGNGYITNRTPAGMISFIGWLLLLSPLLLLFWALIHH
jgi:hypothetical protein